MRAVQTKCNDLAPPSATKPKGVFTLTRAKFRAWKEADNVEEELMDLSKEVQACYIRVTVSNSLVLVNQLEAEIIVRRSQLLVLSEQLPRFLGSRTTCFLY